MKINYKSDFSFVLDICDIVGKGAGVPSYDWQAECYTASPAAAFVASSRGGVLKGCRIDPGGAVVIVADNHHQPCGALKVRVTAWIPNDDFPDGSEALVQVCKTDIELVPTAAVLGAADDVAVLMPYIKGEPFTFDDFTAEQLSDLMKPVQAAAVDAAKTAAGQAATQAAADAVADTNAALATKVTAVPGKGLSANDYSDDDKAKLSALPTAADLESDIAAAEHAYFDKQWLSAGRIYYYAWDTPTSVSSIDRVNHPEAPYILNGIAHTYEEALYTYRLTAINYEGDLQALFENAVPLKTNFPSYFGRIANRDVYAMFNNCINLEVAHISPTYCSPAKANEWFNNCRKLRKIIGVIGNAYANYSYWINAFKDCYLLEELQLQLAGGTLSFADSKRLSYESIKYMFEHRIGTNTVTFHPDVYAKLTGDTTNEAAAALTEEEAAAWQALTQTAADNNITITTV